MGAHFSCKSYETDFITLNKILVVHVDGSLENYEDPTTVDQVTSNFPKHFLCTAVEVLQSGLVPLRLNHQLILGQIYFMLPNYSTLQFNLSPVELVSLTRKLLNIAKTGQCSTKLVATTPPADSICNPQATRPVKLLDRRCGDILGEESMIKSHGWKPILAAITEG